MGASGSGVDASFLQMIFPGKSHDSVISALTISILGVLYGIVIDCGV